MSARRCSAWIGVCVAMLILGLTACVSNQSEHAAGPRTISALVRPAKDIPPELGPYRQRFEDVVTAQGLVFAQTDDPHALQFSLQYSAAEHKVAVYLFQNGRPVVQSYTEPGMLFHKDSEEDLIGALAERTIAEFDDQLHKFLAQVSYTGERPAPHSAGSAPAQPEEGVSFGTAFATNSPTTYVTARHVISDGSDITLYCGQERSGKAHVVEVDSANDLAVLKSDLGAPAFLELAPPDSAAPGDHVFTMGFPTPDLLGVEPKYTDGAISALSGMGDTRSLMQISVPIQPGNSGGPLVDAQGRVIGVIDSTAAVASFYKLSGGALPQNVNFAVNSYYLYPLVKDIPHASTAAFAKLSPVKRVTGSLCLVMVKIGS